MPTPVLVFADDGSLEADRAWLWVTQQAWPGWELEVFSCQPPPIGPPIGALRPRPRPWTPPEPRDAAVAGFETTRHLLAEDDPRIVLTERDDAGLLVLGQKLPGPPITFRTAIIFERTLDLRRFFDSELPVEILRDVAPPVLSGIGPPIIGHEEGVVAWPSGPAIAQDDLAALL